MEMRGNKQWKLFQEEAGWKGGWGESVRGDGIKDPGLWGWRWLGSFIIILILVVILNFHPYFLLSSRLSFIYPVAIMVLSQARSWDLWPYKLVPSWSTVTCNNSTFPSGFSEKRQLDYSSLDSVSQSVSQLVNESVNQYWVPNEHWTQF